MEDATTAERSRARSQLASLLYKQDKVQEVVALYERSDRPYCGELSGYDAFILASAYNAARNYARAEEIYKRQVAVLQKSDKRVRMNTDWLLLGVFIAYNQKSME